MRAPLQGSNTEGTVEPESERCREAGAVHGVHRHRLRRLVAGNCAHRRGGRCHGDHVVIGWRRHFDDGAAAAGLDIVNRPLDPSGVAAESANSDNALAIARCRSNCEGVPRKETGTRDLQPGNLARMERSDASQEVGGLVVAAAEVEFDNVACKVLGLRDSEGAAEEESLDESEDTVETPEHKAREQELGRARRVDEGAGDEDGEEDDVRVVETLVPAPAYEDEARQGGERERDPGHDADLDAPVLKDDIKLIRPQVVPRIEHEVDGRVHDSRQAAPAVVLQEERRRNTRDEGQQVVASRGEQKRQAAVRNGQPAIPLEVPGEPVAVPAEEDVESDKDDQAEQRRHGGRDVGNGRRPCQDLVHERNGKKVS